MKLFWKQFISIVGIVAFGFVILGTIMLQVTFQMNLSREQKQNEKDMQMFHYSLEASLNGLPDGYPANENTIIGIVEVIYDNIGDNQDDIFVYQKDGTVIYKNNKNDHKNWDITLEKNQGAVRIQTVNESHYLESLLVVDMNGTKFYISQYKNIEFIYQNQSQFSKIYFIVLCVVLIISLLVAIIISRSLAKPVLQLSNATNAFANGNFESRVVVKGRNEISDLMRNFNEMANQLEQNVSELKAAAKRQEAFTGAFAHELKTPLTSIIGYSEMLKTMELNSEERIDCANYINQQGKRLERLSYKMLELVGISHGEIEWKPFSVFEVIKEVEKVVQRKLRANNIVLESQVEEENIFGEEDLFLSLILNLVDNARKAIKTDGIIHIEGKRTKEVYTLSVSDNGCGIPEEELERITEAFYMVNKSRARKEGGAGLGMALCEEIIKYHHWEWHIESKMGTGTKVEILIIQDVNYG
ncbi:MAG: HAMP domain-containing histidine kinase [Lachnospiraceae bacterium]|nr:HAMP domain-containing histidine kinase [Lachnospiraceae bacterium]